jgi:hypothetical protein
LQLFGVTYISVAGRVLSIGPPVKVIINGGSRMQVKDLIRELKTKKSTDEVVFAIATGEKKGKTFYDVQEISDILVLNGTFENRVVLI